MSEDGLHDADVTPYLAACPWMRAIATSPFDISVDEFSTRLLREMARSGAAEWRDDRLVARGGYQAPSAGWATTATVPAAWG